MFGNVLPEHAAIGEGILDALLVIPAVPIAIYDAVGVRIDESPVTPDKIIKALEGRLAKPTVPEYDFPPPAEVPPMREDS